MSCDIYILNTACSDDSLPNAAHGCALPMFANTLSFYFIIYID